MEELAKYEPNREIALMRAPEEILSEAKMAAEALTRVISEKPEKVFINGKQYLELEDWSLLGKFYGLTAKIKSSAPVYFGNVKGWEAHAVVVDRTGREISSADAMCLNDEEKWSSKPKYEYVYVLKDGTKSKEAPAKNKMVWIDNPKNPGKKMPKRERVKVADEPVPFFQLRSMAQTRACAKALRNVLSWIVVLAGYQTVSAEEVGEPEVEEEEGSQGGGKEAERAGGDKKPETKSDSEAQGKQPPEEPILEQQKALILGELKKKNLALQHLEGYMGKAIDKFNRYPDVNTALDWINKRKAEKT